MDKIFIKDIKEPSSQGREVVSAFALRRVELRTKDSDNKPFLSLELGDATGRIDGVMWEGAAEAFSRLTAGDIVQVKATVGAYRDSPQLRVEAIARCGPDDYRLADILPHSAFSTSQLEIMLRTQLGYVKEEKLVRLLSLFFDNREYLERFLEAPAAKLWHHAHVGGLAEHTVAVCRLARAALDNYPLLDPDLLMAGCLLHDIGKVEEYRLAGFIDYSDQGRLLGHIVLGDQMLCQRLERIKNFPQERAWRLRHMLLAHHGERERGSPVTPATLEALVLHHCDYLDSHAGAYTRIIKREANGQKRWSDYVNLIDRHLYLPEKPDGEDQPRLL